MASPTLSPFANEPVLELRRGRRPGQAHRRPRAARPRCFRSTSRCTIGPDLRAASGPTIESTDPGDPERLVARAHGAVAADVAAAIDAAAAGLSGWRATSASDRAAALIRAAAWMRERRLELAALEVRECAKPWPEADADVCEAIDFLEYYARGAIELDKGRPADPGPRRTQRAPLRPPRDHGRDLTVELSHRHSLRDDGGGAGHRQRSGPQARRASHRVARCGSFRPCGPAVSPRP